MTASSSCVAGTEDSGRSVRDRLTVGIDPGGNRGGRAVVVTSLPSTCADSDNTGGPTGSSGGDSGLGPPARKLDPDEIEDRLARYGIPLDRPIVTQISRFDRWKDPHGVLDAFELARSPRCSTRPSCSRSRFERGSG